MKNLMIAITFLLAVPAFGEFRVLEPQVDVMEDIKTHTALTESENAIFGSRKDILFVRKYCESGDVEVVLSTHWIIEDTGRVKSRFDKQDVEDLSISLSTDNKALFFSDAESFTSKMKKYNNLAVRYKSAGSSFETPVFKLKGFIKAFNKLCK